MRDIVKAELHKLLLDRKKWMILAAVFLIKLIVYSSQLHIQVNFSPDIYNQYMSKLSAIPQNEQSAYIDAEHARLNDIISIHSSNEEAYHNDEISLDSYKAYMSEYYAAMAHQPAFMAIYEKQQVYSTLSPEQRIFYYDLNWEELFNHLSFDYYLFLLAIIFLVPCFCREYASGSFPLIYVTENGRNKLYASKIIAAICTILLISVFMYAADFAVYFLKYGTNFYEMPIQTVRGMVCEFSTLSIAQYLILITGLKLLWAVCLATVICTLTVFLKNAILSSLVAVAFVLLPWLLADILPLGFNRISIAAGLSGHFLTDMTSVIYACISIILTTIVASLVGGLLWSKTTIIHKKA